MNDVRELASTLCMQHCIGFHGWRQPAHACYKVFQLPVLLFSSKLLELDSFSFSLWQGRAASIEALVLCVLACGVDWREVASRLVSPVIGVHSLRVALLLVKPLLLRTLRVPVSEALKFVACVVQLHVQQMVARKGCPSHFVNVQVVEAYTGGLVWVFGYEPDIHLSTVARVES